MSASNPLFEFLWMNGWRLPNLIVYMVGLVLALVFWRRNPRASLLSMIAFVLFIVGSFLDAVFTWIMMRSSLSSGVEDRATAFGVGHFFFALLGVAAWVLILVALFCRRSQEPTWAREEPERYGRPYPGSDRPSGPPREDIQN